MTRWGTWAILTGLLSSTPAAAQTAREEFEGYAEWRKGSLLVVDGQRVAATAATKFRGQDAARTFDTIPLGYEVKVKGARRADGVVEAAEIEAKPNGTAMFEAELLNTTQKVEAFFLQHRAVPGTPTDRRLLVRGPQVERVKRIALKLVPPYRPQDSFRFYVVEDPEWNASCYANGMIVVNQGLLDAMSDDEVALVLGHEIAHATHEHGRRRMKRAAIVGLVTEAGATAAGSSMNGWERDAVLGAVGLTGMAATNSYSRGNEDQADRVGLRYAHEGGFDVTLAPRVWRRFGRKYPSGGKVHNFFLGSHSLSAARAEKLRLEIARNYPDLRDRLAAAEAAPLPEDAAGANAASAAPAGPTLDVWVARQFAALDNPLHSELTINDQAIGIYTSDGDDPVGPSLRPGWNTIHLKTTPEPGATQANRLDFRIGPVDRIGKERSMKVIWAFGNGTDWELAEGRHRHRLGPDRREVVLDIPVYFSGLEHERREPAAGDYVLKGRAQPHAGNGSVSATILVNGTPLNTFLFNERDVVITPFLKAGRNEITIVSKRIANAVQENDIEFMVYGPVEWDVAQKAFVGPGVTRFGSMQGWTRNPKTGALTSAANPAADTVERVIPLLIKTLPATQ